MDKESPPSIVLTGAQRRFLRGKAHALSPTAYIGKQGLSESALNEVEVALLAHELIKVKLIDFKEQKKVFAIKLAEESRSAHIGTIGHMIILYRPHKNPKKRHYKLPK
ncbi:ribosome assembly RNA-binding protein YhbY [Magnetococcales bacterium HHB-1]